MSSHCELCTWQNGRIWFLQPLTRALTSLMTSAASQPGHYPILSHWRFSLMYEFEVEWDLNRSWQSVLTQKAYRKRKRRKGKRQQGGEAGEERDKRRAPLSARQSLRFYDGKALVMNEKFSIIIQILENSSNQIDQERLGDLVIIGILFFLFVYGQSIITS